MFYCAETVQLGFLAVNEAVVFSSAWLPSYFWHIYQLHLMQSNLCLGVHIAFMQCLLPDLLESTQPKVKGRI